MRKYMDKYYELKKKYREFYLKECIPILKNMKWTVKKKRSPVKDAFEFIIAILLASFIIYCDAAIFHNKENITLYIFIFVIIILAGLKTQKAGYNIEEKMIQIMCKCIGNIHYKNGCNWNCREIKQRDALYIESGLIPKFDLRGSYGHCFYGKFDGIKYEIIDSSFIRTGKFTSYDWFFNGIIIRLEMNKKFNGCTVIRQDSLLHNSPSSSLKHTVLEDVKFEKDFDVFTNDEVEARYLITPSFIEKINKINMIISFSASFYSCSFYQGYLFIALNKAKLLNIFNSNYSQMADNIISILSLIDYFKLNEKTGL